MKKCFAVCCCLLGSVAAITAQDVTSLEKIGPVASFTRTQNGITLTCRDNSQVQLTVLAPDLVRVRTSFGNRIPPKDHSWTIEKKNWSTAHWNFTSTDDSISLNTDELEVVVRRDPLLIEFRDVKTGKVISADEQPMALDTPKGRYDPGRRKLNFVIKSTGRAYKVATAIDDGSARKVRIN